MNFQKKIQKKVKSENQESNIKNLKTGRMLFKEQLCLFYILISF